MAIVKKYAIVTPSDISTVGGVYTMTLPTAPNGFESYMVAQDQGGLSPYEAGADVREVWILKGDDTAIDNWIAVNSSMVIGKTFTEADTIGKELQPAQTITVHKVIIEDGFVVSEEDVNKNIPAFDLQGELDKRGI